jgi:hypothetical protein
VPLGAFKSTMLRSVALLSKFTFFQNLGQNYATSNHCWSISVYHHLAPIDIFMIIYVVMHLERCEYCERVSQKWKNRIRSEIIAAPVPTNSPFKGYSRCILVRCNLYIYKSLHQLSTLGVQINYKFCTSTFECLHGIDRVWVEIKSSIDRKDNNNFSFTSEKS